MLVLPVPVASVSRMRFSPGDSFPARSRPRSPGNSGTPSRRPFSNTERRRNGRAKAFGGEDPRPQVVRRRIGLDIALGAGLHVDLIDAPAVGRKGEARLQAPRVVLGLPDALGVLGVAALGLDHRELAVAEGQNIVAFERLRPPPAALDSARRDRLATDAAALNHAPSGRRERGVDEFGAGLGLVQVRGVLCLRWGRRRPHVTTRP